MTSSVSAQSYSSLPSSSPSSSQSPSTAALAGNVAVAAGVTGSAGFGVGYLAGHLKNRKEIKGLKATLKADQFESTEVKQATQKALKSAQKSRMKWAIRGGVGAAIATATVATAGIAWFISKTKKALKSVSPENQPSDSKTV